MPKLKPTCPRKTKNTKKTPSVSESVIGCKGTPFPHLQFLAESVPPPQIVTTLAKSNQPFPEDPNLNV